MTKSWTTVSVDGNSEWFSKQAAMVNKVVATMPVHFQVNYKAAVKNDQSLTICNSEVFYVPRHFVSDFIDLVNLVGDLDIHHKVAMPMFFIAMDSLDNFDPVLDTMVYKRKPPSSNITFYSAEAAAVHPWSVSSEHEFIKLTRLMAVGDPLLLELV